MTERVRVTTEQIDVSTVKPHPRNPRRGNVDLLMDSLRAHGQYRPILVHKSTRHVLAGNHTLQAAIRLGWRTIAATILDVDDTTADRILLADNRISDLAAYDNNALSELLHSLPDLDGTGYTPLDLDQLDGLFDPDPEEPTEPKPDKDPKTPATIKIADTSIWVDPRPLDVWRSTYTEMKKPDANELLRAMLGFPDRAKPNPKDRHSPEHISATVETVPIKTLKPFPNNAREGDIGAICESLKAFGQYRPVVARRDTSEILVGNHTWRAAKHLGWKNLAVAWVDVNDEQATRIVLIDNRSSDLAGYDNDALLASLTTTPDLTGTGFTLDDLDDLINDIQREREHKPAGKDLRCKIDKWAFKVTPVEYADWLAKDPTDLPTRITRALGLPDGSWTTENPE